MWGNFESVDLQIEEIPFKSLSPPTHYLTNDVTCMFQEMVNTYGVPTYGEANPAMFAVVSFPFLFGVMYGDIGHGFILLLAWPEYSFAHFQNRSNTEKRWSCFTGLGT